MCTAGAALPSPPVRPPPAPTPLLAPRAEWMRPALAPREAGAWAWEWWGDPAHSSLPRSAKLNRPCSRVGGAQRETASALLQPCVIMLLISTGPHVLCRPCCARGSLAPGTRSIAPGWSAARAGSPPVCICTACSPEQAPSPWGAPACSVRAHGRQGTGARQRSRGGDIGARGGYNVTHLGPPSSSAAAPLAAAPAALPAAGCRTMSSSTCSGTSCMWRVSKLVYAEVVKQERHAPRRSTTSDELAQQQQTLCPGSGTVHIPDRTLASRDSSSRGSAVRSPPPLAPARGAADAGADAPVSPVPPACACCCCCCCCTTSDRCWAMKVRQSVTSRSIWVGEQQPVGEGHARSGGWKAPSRGGQAWCHGHPRKPVPVYAGTSKSAGQLPSLHAAARLNPTP
mgnify:CR=1 FL=1